MTNETNKACIPLSGGDYVNLAEDNLCDVNGSFLHVDYQKFPKERGVRDHSDAKKSIEKFSENERKYLDCITDDTGMYCGSAEKIAVRYLKLLRDMNVSGFGSCNDLLHDCLVRKDGSYYGHPDECVSYSKTIFHTIEKNIKTINSGNPINSAKIVTFDGFPSAGKTTTIGQVASRFDTLAVVVGEEFDCPYFEGKFSNFYRIETWFSVTSKSAIYSVKDSKAIVLQDRSECADFVFSIVNVLKGKMTGKEHCEFMTHVRSFNFNLKRFLMVILCPGFDVIIERMRLRNRSLGKVKEIEVYDMEYYSIFMFSFFFVLTCYEQEICMITRGDLDEVSDLFLGYYRKQVEDEKQESEFDGKEPNRRLTKRMFEAVYTESWYENQYATVCRDNKSQIKMKIIDPIKVMLDGVQAVIESKSTEEKHLFENCKICNMNLEEHSRYKKIVSSHIAEGKLPVNLHFLRAIEDKCVIESVVVPWERIGRAIDRGVVHYKDSGGNLKSLKIEWLAFPNRAIMYANGNVNLPFDYSPVNFQKKECLSLFYHRKSRNLDLDVYSVGCEIWKKNLERVA